MSRLHTLTGVRVHDAKYDHVGHRLFALPVREAPRARHTRAGRALHLVDAENLMGGPHADRVALVDALCGYRDLAPIDPHDHVVVAVNPGLLPELVHCPFTARLACGTGPDGADRALLDAVEDTAFVSTRYDLVVIGSGDGIFQSVVEEYTPIGIAVGVVARSGCVSHGLAECASFVRLLPAFPEEKRAA